MSLLPDEDAPGGTAVAEPTPQLDTEERPEDAPEAEQPEGVSGPEQEEGSPDWLASTREALAGLTEEEREQFLNEGLPDELKAQLRGPDSEERTVQSWAELATSAFQDIAARESAPTEMFRQDRFAGAVKNYLEQLNAEQRKSVQEYKDARAEDITLFDPDKAAQRIAAQASLAGPTFAKAAVAHLESAVIQAMTTHPAFLHANQDDLNRIADAAQQFSTAPDHRIASYLQIMLDVALRAAPEEIKKRTRADVQKELDVAERYSKLLTAVRRNGKRIDGAGAATGGKTYRDMTDDERAKLTSEQIDAMTAKYL